jgi:hypothetical protein
MPSLEDSASYSDFFSPAEWDSIDFGSWGEPTDLELDELQAADDFLVSSGAADAVSGSAPLSDPAPGDSSPSHSTEVEMSGSYADGDARFRITCAMCGHIGITGALADAETVALLHESFIAVLVDAWEVTR